VGAAFITYCEFLLQALLGGGGEAAAVGALDACYAITSVLRARVGYDASSRLDWDQVPLPSLSHWQTAFIGCSSKVWRRFTDWIVIRETEHRA